MNKTKELIIQTTIKMIKEADSDPTKITIRDISKQADIAVSQINYHFQSKENLISQCVQLMVKDIIGLYDNNLKNLENLINYDKLKYMANLTYSFLYDNENLARISILSDYQNAKADDNTRQTMNAYFPLIAKICEERNIQDARLVTELLVLALQSAFLRTDILQEELSTNLRNPEERKQFINEVLELYLR